MHLVTTLSPREGRDSALEWKGRTLWLRNAVDLVTEVTQSGDKISPDKTPLSHGLLFAVPLRRRRFPTAMRDLLTAALLF